MRSLAFLVFMSGHLTVLTEATGGRVEEQDVWNFTKVVEDIEFSIQVQWASSTFFEELSSDFFKDLLIEEGLIESSGGGMTKGTQNGVSVARISVHAKSELDASALGRSVEETLKNEFSGRNVSVVGRSASGAPPAFSLYYETEKRYGGVHSTVIPFENGRYILQFIVQESPLLAVTHDTEAEPDGDANSVKPRRQSKSD